MALEVPRGKLKLLSTKLPEEDDEEEESLYDAYISYTSQTECPTIYHRWCCISAIGSLLGRSIFLQHGHFRIFPNLYVMIIGSPGARKSTAIKMSKNILSGTDYNTFAAEKTSKEKFLLDLEGLEIEGEDSLNGKNKKKSYDSLTEQNLWGDNFEMQDPKEVFIVADEFNEFAGSGNMEFYTTLGNLWDWDNSKVPYRQRLKNSRSVSIYQPTVSILAGNTPENFARAFPPEVIGQGFLSRFLFIHGSRTNRKFAFPPSPEEEETDRIVKRFKDMKEKYSDVGEVRITEAAKQLLTTIYDRWTEIPDPRFAHYSTRRYTMLLKLSLISLAAAMQDEITTDTIILSNTILTAAENLMPKALGEFGKARNSDVANKIMEALQHTRKPMSFRDMWTLVSNDLDKPTMLSEMMQGLVAAEKVQLVQGTTGGWLPRNKLKKEAEFCDFSLLTEEERQGI